ncbi:MAG: SemiSWEET family transporter [Legionella sp.]|uniref:SemiSWEET family transporter n=1 Tax=Legionella sp. TaxID=459 RepID=UPI00285035CB|nr:SemiSWEET family transporter [Legionella sp.]
MLINVLGFVAGFLTFVCFLPQVYQIIKTKDTRSLSLITQIIYVVGAAMWFAFSIAAGSWTAAMFNILSTALASVILYYKIKFK